MRIGELATRANVGIETVRYYERRQLLPEPARSVGGYREYAETDLRRLRFILGCKELGFTLSEIRELLELRVTPGRTADDVRGQARRKLGVVEAKIAELERIRSALNRLVDACSGTGPPDECALMHAVGGDRDF